jgi:hypothetical protein
VSRISVFALLLLSGVACAQSADTSFVLDGSKPYVYLAFDHVGARKPIALEEGSEGLWLRIVNNCKVPIRVNTFRGDLDGTGVVVFDEIVPIIEGFTVHGESGVIQTDQSPVQDLIGDETSEVAPSEKPKQTPGNVARANGQMPRGYSAELSFVSRVLPGKSLLFSVPRNHVSHDWFMRVKFTLDVSKPSVGAGPVTELDFFNEQIPVTHGSLGDGTSQPPESLNHESSHVDPSRPQ